MAEAGNEGGGRSGTAHDRVAPGSFEQFARVGLGDNLDARGRQGGEEVEKGAPAVDAEVELGLCA